MITILHRGGYAQMITILHRGGGSLGTPKSDYVICARPLTKIESIAGFCWIKLDIYRHTVQETYHCLGLLCIFGEMGHVARVFSQFEKLSIHVFAHFLFLQNRLYIFISGTMGRWVRGWVGAANLCGFNRKMATDSAAAMAAPPHLFSDRERRNTKNCKTVVEGHGQSSAEVLCRLRTCSGWSERWWMIRRSHGGVQTFPLRHNQRQAGGSGAPDPEPGPSQCWWGSPPTHSLHNSVPFSKVFSCKERTSGYFFLSAAKPLIGWFVRKQAGIGRHSAAEVPAILPSSCRTSSDQHNQLWLSWASVVMGQACSSPQWRADTLYPLQL